MSKTVASLPATTSQSMLGNQNSQMGAMHKAMVARRMSDPKDAFAKAAAKAAGVSALADCVGFANGEADGMARQRSDIGALMVDAEGREFHVEIMAKTCSGFGSSNQTARFWGSDLIGQADSGSPVEMALRSILGSLSATDSRIPHSTPGQLARASFAKSAKPLMHWLGKPSSLEAIANAAFGVDSATKKGEKLLALSMRQALPGGEDLHLFFDRVELRDAVVSRAAELDKQGAPFVRIGSGDEALNLGGILRLKRKGGDSGQRIADQAQACVSPRELHRAWLGGSLGASSLSEAPCQDSMAIQMLASERAREAAEEESAGELARQSELAAA